MALTDSVLIFFTTLSLYGFWLGVHGEGRERHALWLFYIGMALATLTKGPIGFFDSDAGRGLYLWLTRSWPLFRRRGHLIPGLILFVALALPWYLMMLNIHGQRYTTSAQGDTIGRFFGAMEGHGGTLLFYIPVFLLGFFPERAWLPFAWHQSYRSWREARRTGALLPVSRPRLRPTPTPRDALEWFAAAWVLGIHLFSLSSTRLPHYIGPLFPGAAILAACYWNRCVSDQAAPGLRAAIHIMTAVGSVLALAFAVLPRSMPNLPGSWWRSFPWLGRSPWTRPYTVASIFLPRDGTRGLFRTERNAKTGCLLGPRAAHWPSSCWPPCS